MPQAPSHPVPSASTHPSALACEQDRLECAGTADSDVDRRFCDAAFDACSMSPGLPSVTG